MLFVLLISEFDDEAQTLSQGHFEFQEALFVTPEFVHQSQLSHLLIAHQVILLQDVDQIILLLTYFEHQYSNFSRRDLA